MGDSSNYRPRRTTRRTLLGGLATGGAGALAGCSTILGTGSTATLRIGTGRPPVTPDPIADRSIGSEQVVDRIFDGLFAYGEGTDVPAIAVGIAGLVSTASAINSTLFSGALFAKNLISDDILPHEMGDPAADAAPKRAVIVIGILTAAFTALGPLEAVVEFASLAFIVVFATMSELVLTVRDAADVNPVPSSGRSARQRSSLC